MIILYGVPGSGKSTLAQKLVEKDPENTVVVERDEIRTALFGADYHNRTPDKKSEKTVSDVHSSLIRNGLKDGKTVVVADTNLNPKTVAHLSHLAKTVEFLPLDVSPDECRRRNMLRERVVPDAVMDRMIEKAYGPDGHLKKWTIGSNGRAFLVGAGTPGQKTLEKLSEDLSKKYPDRSDRVVLVDCDGTLANNKNMEEEAFGNGKKDFDLFFRKIAESEVNESVLNLCKKLREEGNTLYMLTGRSAKYGKELATFVRNSGAPISKVIAKPDDDMRPTKDFKQEILNTIRNNGKTVVAAIDDDPAILQLWHDEGILCHAVSQEKLADGTYTPAEIQHGNCYHISPKTGKPARCFATVRACPVGGPHYPTKEAAFKGNHATLSESLTKTSGTLPKNAENFRHCQEASSSEFNGQIEMGRGYCFMDVPKERVEPYRQELIARLGEKEASQLFTNLSARPTGDGFHVTVFSPAETRALTKKKGEDWIRAHQETANYTIVGLGTASNEKSRTFFAIVESPDLQNIRQKAGLGKKDFHITLGFTNGDVFDQPKDRSSLI